ncbi:nitrogenase-stabilizing/protective protein NifW [Pantanalinema sp. GBBB05]|uniref:nitrogenase-stabilizing/protective protein NifW n=1 Tax=Pantanalinema sp. GBBB05 TaxID=2604139 RepID=UPI001DF394F4|nr:nitrogenase-stabilizing/protective protein NifW [Pantanalinema sp. GBBB05]
MTTLAEFKAITDAEAYFEFFQLEYDPTVVNVNRLHILKKFSQLIAEIDAEATELTEVERLNCYQEALVQSYNVFLTTSPLQTKLFKVFNEKPKNVVLLTDIQTE